MSIDAAVSIFSTIYGFVGPPIIRQCDYTFFYKNHAKDLKDEIQKLVGAKARVEHSIDEARHAGEYIQEDVMSWLGSVDEQIASGNLILETNKVGRFLGYVPNPKACHKLGRSAKNSIPELQKVFELGKTFENVSYRSVVGDPSSLIVGASLSSRKNYVVLKSRTTILESVMKALDDDKIGVIGVYGMGGVGKTTVMKEVENQARESNKFDAVVSVFVSQTPDMTKIRAEIDYRLKRLGSDESRKTALILLDDLWDEVDLKNIGVPDNNKCKVKFVLTSRNQHLLAGEMNCHRIFSLGVLDVEEGWSFFAKLLSSSSKVEELKKNSTAAKLLKKCAGLPVAIEALATIWKKKMMNHDSPSSSNYSGSFNIDELEINGNESPDGSLSIELSYNYLGDSYEEKQAKLMFRIIGLLGTPIVPVLTLLKYTVGLGSYSRSTNHNIMERGRREIIRSLRTLQDSSLLLESDDSEHAKIHDVVRDVAAGIASRDDRALIFNHFNGVNEWSLEKLKECTAISLPYSAISELDDKGWECPDLQVFIMELAEQGDRHVVLPDNIFTGMIKLRVIHLKHARFTSLPSSLQVNLRKLTTLCLDYCYLENIDDIGKLESLEVLSLIGCEITKLTKEIGGLTSLRMLDLSKCSKLASIEPGVLQRLTRLEELYLRESFDGWEVENNASLAELNYLPHLSTLEVSVPDTSKLPPNLPFGNLVRYEVLLGNDRWGWSSEYKCSRTLKLKVNDENILTEEWLQSALQKTQDLHLDGLNEIKKSFHELCGEGFEELMHLHLQNSSSVKYVTWSTEWLACSAFTILDSMILNNMEGLEKICHGLILPTSFSKLKVVKVQSCPKLRNLFDLSLVRSLTELEEIELSDCKMVEEIVFAEQMDDNGGGEAGGGDGSGDHGDDAGDANDGGDEDAGGANGGGDNDDDGKNSKDHQAAPIGCFNHIFCCPIRRSRVSSKKRTRAAGADYEIVLGKLRCLTLRSLPEMTTFFTKEAPIGFFNEVSSTKTHLGLHNLCRLELVDCKNIVCFISSHMLMKLVNLESLTIVGCESLKEIFDVQGVGANGGDISILPNLYELKLKRLRKLEHIWKNNSRQIKGCQKLRTVEIHDCGRLQYVSSSSMCGSMKNLTEINVGSCSEMQAIFMEEEEPTSTYIKLTSLKILAISQCPSLKAFSTGAAASTTSTSTNTSNSFFSEKIWLPSLVVVTISSVGGFQKLWSDEVPDQSYCNLESIHLNSCNEVSTVIPATLIERLQNLRQLRLHSCGGLETVINFDVDWKTKKKPSALMLPQLQEVMLESLDKLRHMMEPRDSEIVVGFPSLTRLKVESCEELIYLIPTTTATTLLRLESLEITRCWSLKEVIHGEIGERNKRDDLTFPHLTSLIMISLGRLTCFSSEDYLFDFTRLKALWIFGCDRLETLVKGDRWSWSKALFNDKVNLPNLEELHIASDEVEELWCSEQRSGSFCKLKLLGISRSPRLLHIIPSFMIKRLQSLENLMIGDCESLEHIFEMMPTSSKQIELHGKISLLPKLTSLELERLPRLSNLLPSGTYTLEFLSLQKLSFYETGGAVAAFIGKVNLPNLEELCISKSQVEELWGSEPPSGGSLCKLKLLKIDGAPRLRNIVPSFMIKTLQNLESIEILKCESLEHIFKMTAASTEQIDVHVHGTIISVLPKLTSLRLEELPKLSKLSPWGSNSLELLSLKKLSINGAVAAAIEKVHLPNIEELKVSNDDTTELWHSEPYVGSFCELKELEVDRCGQLVKIVPLFMLKRLQNLEKLVVKRCRQLEIVSELGSGRGLNNYNVQESESKLQSIHPFQKLASIHVENCERVRNLFSISDGEATNSDKLIIALPQLTNLRLEHLPSFSQLLFRNDELQYTLKMSSLKDFILIGSGDKKAVTHKVVFPELCVIREHDDNTFFGSTTSVVRVIMNALLQQTNQDNKIIGLLGVLDLELSKILERQLTEEGVGQLVLLGGGAKEIQEELGKALDIIYSDARTEERAERLRTSLSNNCDKKLILMLTHLELEVEMDVEVAVGIPHPREMDPKFFKLILLSEDVEELNKMGAQQVINIGDTISRWQIFRKQLNHLKAVPAQQELPGVDDMTTNMKDDTSSFFDGSATAVLNDIMKALHSHQNKNNPIIIGFLAVNQTSYGDLRWDLQYLLSQEANEFELLYLGPKTDEIEIQNELKKMLVITYEESTKQGERAERIRETLLNKRHKRVLLVLEDLDKPINLETVGIPKKEELESGLFKIIAEPGGMLE